MINDAKLIMTNTYKPIHRHMLSSEHLRRVVINPAHSEADIKENQYKVDLIMVAVDNAKGCYSDRLDDISNPTCLYRNEKMACLNPVLDMSLDCVWNTQPR